ncbi:MAG: hypothetical protein AB7H71_17730 [Alphaproteobacteria bacterium]
MIGLTTVAVLLTVRLIERGAREGRVGPLPGAATEEIPCGREFARSQHRTL